MKTASGDGANQVVLDKPKGRESSARQTTKPSVDTSKADTKRQAKGSRIYIDGEFFAEEDAKVSVFDHGLLYGDGIFEGIRFYNGRVFRLAEHLERLWDSARSICLEIPMSMPAMNTIRCAIS